MSQRGFCTIKEKSVAPEQARCNNGKEKPSADPDSTGSSSAYSGEKEIRKYNKWRERQRERESGRQARVS